MLTAPVGFPRRRGVAEPPLVLSIFPGIGMLDLAFEREGFCVVQGPDPLWGGDIRRFHPPSGAFDGIIGGDPCQSHSLLANLVRAKGLEPRFPDLSAEYERVVEEAQPEWFLRENVPGAPDIAPHGYAVHSFILDNSWLEDECGIGHPQMRRRRFWFGVRGNTPIDLRRHVNYATLLLPDRSYAVTSPAERVPVRIGGSDKLKRTARAPAVCGRHEGHLGSPTVDRSARYALADMLELQGLPEDFLQHSPFTMDAKRKMIGNGVPLSMGVALARAILEAQMQ